MSIKINTFTFKNEDIEVEVPFDNEHYLNATSVYQDFGKPKDAFSYWKKNTLIPYATRLLELNKIPSMNFSDLAEDQPLTLADVIVTRSGGNDLLKRGTWLHPKLAILFARWLSLDFEIWCDEKIAELLNIGMTRMSMDDLKHLELMTRVIDHASANDKQFARIIKSMLVLHEKQGYNIKKFDELMTAVGAAAEKTGRVQLYEKISKVIESLYQAGDLDITTRERMKKVCDERLISLLKSRATKAENKLARVFTLKDSSVDKDTHDQLVAVTAELRKAKDDLEASQAKALGSTVAASPDGSIVLLSLTTDNIVGGLRELVNKAVDLKYTVVFQDFLTPKTQVEGKKYPNFVGEYSVPMQGRTSASIWKNESHNFMRLTRVGVDGQYYTLLELTMTPIKEDPNTYRALNKAGTVCAIYNEPTNCLVVYALPKSKN